MCLTSYKLAQSAWSDAASLPSINPGLHFVICKKTVPGIHCQKYNKLQWSPGSVFFILYTSLLHPAQKSYFSLCLFIHEENGRFPAHSHLILWLYSVDTYITVNTALKVSQDYVFCFSSHCAFLVWISKFMALFCVSREAYWVESNTLPKMQVVWVLFLFFKKDLCYLDHCVQTQ